MEEEIQSQNKEPTRERLEGIASKILGGKVYGPKTPEIKKYFNSFMIGSLFRGPIAIIDPEKKEVVYYHPRHEDKISRLLDNFNAVSPKGHWYSLAPNKKN